MTTRPRFVSVCPSSGRDGCRVYALDEDGYVWALAQSFNGPDRWYRTETFAPSGPKPPTPEEEAMAEVEKAISG